MTSIALPPQLLRICALPVVSAYAAEPAASASSQLAAVWGGNKEIRQ
jgi:hypothetical protein